MSTENQNNPANVSKEGSLVIRQEEDLFNLQGIVNVLKQKWWLFFLSLGLFLTVAFAYIRWFAQPQYEAQMTVLLKEQKSGSGIESFIDGLELINGADNISNQINLMASYKMATQTLEELDFDVSYFTVGNIKTIEYYQSLPFQVVLDTAHYQLIEQEFAIEILSDSTYRLLVATDDIKLYLPSRRFLTKNKKLYPKGSFNYRQTHLFGDTVSSPLFSFVVLPAPINEEVYIDPEARLVFVINDMNKVINQYHRDLQISSTDRTSSVVELTLRGPVQEKIKNYLSTLGQVYLRENLEDKNLIATNTIKFIEEQLILMSDSLKSVEANLEAFRRQENMLTIESSAKQIFDRQATLLQRKEEMATRLKYYKYLQDYLAVSNVPDKIIAPSAMGIDDPLLNNLISEVSKLNAEREALTYSVKKDNPYFVLAGSRLETAMRALRENVKNIIATTKIAIQENSRQIAETGDFIQSLPSTERSLVDIQRKFDFNNSLYNYLLQKRAEAGIAKASNITDNKILDEAMLTSNKPVSPQKALILIAAFIIGLVLPASFLIVQGYLDDRIKSPDVLEKYGLSIIGKVRLDKHRYLEDGKPLLVQVSARSAIAESFRSLRLSLGYVVNAHQHKVIGLTSSVSGEGKTFCAVNLAVALAHADYRVVVVGCDMRKTRLHQNMGVSNDKGLSQYLVGQAKINEVIKKTEISKVDVVTAGETPPNPGELLGTLRFKELISQLKAQYDYVLLDSSPVGLVADYIAMLPEIDVNLFVVREGYTREPFLYNVNKLSEYGINKAYVLYNAMQAINDNYGYGGYGYGYYDNEDDNARKGWFGFLKKR